MACGWAGDWGAVFVGELAEVRLNTLRVVMTARGDRCRFDQGKREVIAKTISAAIQSNADRLAGANFKLGITRAARLLRSPSIDGGLDAETAAEWIAYAHAASPKIEGDAISRSRAVRLSTACS